MRGKKERPPGVPHAETATKAPHIRLQIPSRSFRHSRHSFEQDRALRLQLFLQIASDGGLSTVNIPCKSESY